MPSNMHENFAPRDAVKSASERSFGLVFAVLFLLIALAPLRHGLPVRTWSFGVSAVFLVVALLSPRLLRPLNMLWFRFGLLLHKVISPVILLVLYWVSVVPVGLILKALGKDPLRLKLEREQESYWIMRDPKDFTPDTMRRQF